MLCAVASVMSNSLQRYGLHQAPLCMGFSRQEYWSGLPCPPPGDLSHPRTEPSSLLCPALEGRFFPPRTTWEAGYKRRMSPFELGLWFTWYLFRKPDDDRPLLKTIQVFCGTHSSVQFSSVTQLCPTLCDPMNHSTPGLPVHHQLPESTQNHVHCAGVAIQPSHPLSSPSPPALKSFPASGSFQMSQLFASGGQSVGVSASTSVLPTNTQD